MYNSLHQAVSKKIMTILNTWIFPCLKTNSITTWLCLNCNRQPMFNSQQQLKFFLLIVTARATRKAIHPSTQRVHMVFVPDRKLSTHLHLELGQGKHEHQLTTSYAYQLAPLQMPASTSTSWYYILATILSLSLHSQFLIGAAQGEVCNISRVGGKGSQLLSTLSMLILSHRTWHGV